MDQNEKERFIDERSLSGKVEELFDRGIVDAQALNFIRGRSISKTYLVIDEAQNLTPKQAPKGIITRAGLGTKIILLGDPQQIDHPLLDERTQRLELRSGKNEGQPAVLAGHHVRRRMRAFRPGYGRGKKNVNGFDLC